MEYLTLAIAKTSIEHHLQGLKRERDRGEDVAGLIQHAENALQEICAAMEEKTGFAA